MYGGHFGGVLPYDLPGIPTPPAPPLSYDRQLPGMNPVVMYRCNRKEG